MPKLKDRVIIDTNLWISFLINKDYSKLDKILSDKQAMLLYSQELIDEFIEVAQRPNSDAILVTRIYKLFFYQ